MASEKKKKQAKRSHYESDSDQEEEYLKFIGLQSKKNPSYKIITFYYWKKKKEFSL